MKIALFVDNRSNAQAVKQALERQSSFCAVEQADYIVCIGGDGFMLQTVHTYLHLNKPFYGLNTGHVGFLMNNVSTDINILQYQLQMAHAAILHPLSVQAQFLGQKTSIKALAINEVSLMRSSSQAAKLRIAIDDVVRMEQLVCDGMLVATPAGSTAYNFSAYGPILPLESRLLAMTPISAFRPRRWRGALLSQQSKIAIDVLYSDQRPVDLYCDANELGKVTALSICEDPSLSFTLLFDNETHLAERILQEQFAS